jgi:hypothetical protein
LGGSGGSSGSMISHSSSLTNSLAISSNYPDPMVLKECLRLATFQLRTARSPRTPGETAAGKGERRDAEQQDTTAPRLTRRASFSEF